MSKTKQGSPLLAFTLAGVLAFNQETRVRVPVVAFVVCLFDLFSAIMPSDSLMECILYIYNIRGWEGIVRSDSPLQTICLQYN